jgi:hypothetical protein
MNRPCNTSVCALLALLAFSTPALAQPVANTFTFQGELTASGQALSGDVDLQFTLWSSQENGSFIGAAQDAPGVAVTDGKFNVLLNAAGEFGTAPFDGTQRWLEIAVRPAGSGDAFTTLTPRQPLTATPYASFALAAATANSATTANNASNFAGQPSTYYRNAANLTGSLADARLSANVPRYSAFGTFTGANSFVSPQNRFVGIGTGLTALNASSLASGTVADALLSPNVVLRTAANTLTGANTFSGNNTFSGANTFASPSNSFTGVGTGLTALNASNLASGTVSDARLSSNIARKDAANVLTGANVFTNANFFSSWLGVGNATPNSAFRMQLTGGSGPWSGAIAAGGATSAVVLGELNGLATLGAHNGALNGWADLYLSPSGKVAIGNLGAPATTLHVTSGTTATASSGGILTVGSTLGTQIAMDGDTIMARAGQSQNVLHLNTGGRVRINEILFENGSTLSSGKIKTSFTNTTPLVIGARNRNGLSATVNGARPGDTVIVNPRGALDVHDILGYARVSANNTVVWTIYNVNPDPFSNDGSVYVNAIWDITVLK